MLASRATKLTYQERIGALRKTKLRHTQEKQVVEGSANYDDFPTILPPPDQREVVETVSGSGVVVRTVRVKGLSIKSNGPGGAFFGPRLCGENFRAFLGIHPTYVDPMSSLAGAMMMSFLAYRKDGWTPGFFDYSHLHEEQEKYQIMSGIGGLQHFCHDLAIGLDLGWGGLLGKVRRYRGLNAPRGAELYDGMESWILGMQDWILRHVNVARQMAKEEEDPQLQENLEQMAEINEHLVTDPPRTFREALQWILWYQLAAKMYDSNGAFGRPDVLLRPYYERDVTAGILTDEEAVFHIACFLERETPYLHLGGPDEVGKDVTNRLSFLFLEAAHRLKIPANLAVCVGKGVDPNLLRRSVEILFEDKTGIPKFLGIDNIIEGFARNGYPNELARQRAYSGCHWFALPGCEYTLNDLIKIGLGFVFTAALREMLMDCEVSPSADELWSRFEKHLRRAIEIVAEGLDFHYEHMHKYFPELVLDVLCYGPIERGLDASHGGVDYYNWGVDATGLATVADSFAALEQRVEREKRLTWEKAMHYLDTDWAGPEGEPARLMMKSISRFGSGASRADEWAVHIASTFTRLVKEKPTPAGRNMIPGIFSWSFIDELGKDLPATPDGRHAGDPISHGANPSPGFRGDGAATALALAVASVQSGFGNPSPMQMDIDPGLAKDQGGLEKVENLIKTHFNLGGTEINLNVMDAAAVIEASKDPSKYPDLVVRVTGYSAYFARLTPEYRQMVVDRMLAER
jgi:formate C-acetyltransferase